MLDRSKSTARRSSWLVIGLLAATLGTVATVPASAGPIGFQVAGGWYTETEEFFLEAGARIGAGSFTIIPNIDYLFTDDGTAYSLNVDGTLSILPLGVVSMYGGAGIGWLTVDPDRGDSETNTIYSLIVGAGVNTFPMKPFGQFKYVIADGDDPLVFMGGVRF